MSDLFLRACRREPVERTPIWIMRQAGRYLPEYRAVREKVDFLTLCKTPDLAAQVTLQPVERFGLDAAILFSDIMIPAAPMGVRVEFRPGPVVEPAIRTAADIDRLRVVDPREEVPFVYEALRLVRGELDGRVPVIGFAAAPFTLAAYLIEGSGSKQFPFTRQLLYSDPAAAHRLLDKITDVTLRYLEAQVEAGAQALQLFDSWAGLLARGPFAEFALRYANRVIEPLRSAGVPLIYFAVNSGHLMEEIRECRADVVGIDWRLDLDEASRRLDGRFALQGNLDPCLLLSTAETVERGARRVLERAASLPGHIFNLGHGILPATPPENVEALVRAVRGG